METTTRQPSAPPRAGDDRVLVEPARRSPFVRIVIILAIAIVVILVLIFGIRFLAYATTHETTDDATIDADQVEVTSKIAERVNSILVDTNQPVHKGQLIVVLDNQDERTRVAQAQAAVNAQRAQAKAAQESVALTRDTQVAQNTQGQGAIQQAQASIRSADAMASSSHEQNNAALAAVDAARAQLKVAEDGLPGARQNMLKAQADLHRTTSLVSTGDLPQSQLDADRAGYKAAWSSYQQASANVSAANASLAQAQQKYDSQLYATSSQQAQIGVQQAQLTSAQGKFQESDAPARIPAQQAQADAAVAQVGSLIAQLKTAQDQLSYTRIYSPINGFVGEKDVEVGHVVSPGLSLMTLVPSSPIYITANYKETQVGRMKVGEAVDINVDACNGVKFQGHVDDLSPATQNRFSLVPAQNATGNFVKVTQRLPVRILFDHPSSDCPLRPGMSVETSVKVK